MSDGCIYVSYLSKLLTGTQSPSHSIHTRVKTRRFCSLHRADPEAPRSVAWFNQRHHVGECIFIRKTSSYKRQRLSSVKGRLPSKFVLCQRSSYVKGCLGQKKVKGGQTPTDNQIPEAVLVQARSKLLLVQGLWHRRVNKWHRDRVWTYTFNL